MVQVTAGWALSGKRPGSSDDYGVLNSSREPFTSAGFGRILRQYGLGTPPAHRTGEGALPWVTVSWVGEAPDRYLGLSIEDWTEHRDGSGRPVAFTKYICVPYQDVEASPVSYAALYRELLRVDLPMDGDPGGRVALSPPEYSPTDIARDIERFDRGKVMRTAALLLDGRVDVVGAGEASLLDRLAFLDAVAALLPYGYRADFTGATWATGPASKIRLAFTRRVRDGAREVSWRGQGEHTPLSQTAQRYLRLLNGLLSRDRDLAWLVGYLAGGSEPRDFGDPTHALRRLADVEWPREVVRAVAARDPGAPAEARRLLLGARLREIVPADQSRVLVCLIRDARPDDLPLIEQRWDQAAATGGSELMEALVEAAAKLLWREEPDERVSRYAKLATSRRIADPFLAGLVRRGGHPGPGGPTMSRAARTMAAELIRDHVDPSDPAWAGSQLLVELNNASGLAAALLAAEHRGPERIEAWVRWLGVRMRDMLPQFGELLAGKEVSLKKFRGLVAGHPEWAAALIQVAGRLGRLEPVMAPLIGWMREQPEIGPAAREFVTATLHAMVTEEPGGWGASDAVLLLAGSPPRYLEEAVKRADSGTYHNGFVWVWTRAREHRGMAATLARELTVALRQRRPWRGHPDRADVVINLVRALVADQEVDWTQLTWVLDTDPPDRDLTERPAFGALRDQLRENKRRHQPAPVPVGIGSPGAPDSSGSPGSSGVSGLSGGALDALPPPGPVPPSLGASVIASLGPLAPGAGLDEVADFYVRAVEKSWSSVPSALQAVLDAGRALTAYEAHTVSEKVWSLLTTRYNEQWADKQVLAMIEAIAQGGLGEDVAAALPDVLADRATSEVAHQLRLLEAATRDAAAWEASQQIRTRLEEIKSTAERIAKHGRGGRFGLGRRKSGDG